MTTITDTNRRTTYIDGLSSIFLFRYLNDSARSSLGEFVEFFEYDPGEVIVQEGEKTPYMYIVMDGSVNVFAGEVFGEAGVFLKMRRTASVKSADESVIMRLRRESFVKFVRSQPRAANTVLLVMVHSLLRKLRDTNQELAFERKLDSDQGDIDAMIEGFLQGDAE